MPVHHKVDRGRFRTSPKGVEKWFTDLPPARVAMEAETHSIWISEQLQELVACRSEFVTADAAGRVGVLPLDGPSIGGVGVDVAAKFAS